MIFLSNWGWFSTMIRVPDVLNCAGETMVCLVMKLHSACKRCTDQQSPGTNSPLMMAGRRNYHQNAIKSIDFSNHPDPLGLSLHHVSLRFWPSITGSLVLSTQKQPSNNQPLWILESGGTPRISIEDTPHQRGRSVVKLETFLFSVVTYPLVN